MLAQINSIEETLLKPFLKVVAISNLPATYYRLLEMCSVHHTWLDITLCVYASNEISMQQCTITHCMGAKC